LLVKRVRGGRHCVVDFKREPLRRLPGAAASPVTAEAIARVPQLAAEEGMQ